MIVVSGEALMDVFAAGSTATGVMLDARIGGSPLNVATGLARLAQPVAFFGAVSQGFLGDRLMQALQAEGIDTGLHGAAGRTHHAEPGGPGRARCAQLRLLWQRRG
jgi:fructokinase